MMQKIYAVRHLLTAILKCENGQALIEASLTVPFFLLLLLGAFNLARAAYMGIEVSDAAKAAAQYAAQNSATAADTSAIQDAAAADASDLVSLTTSVSVAGMCSDGSSCTGAGGSCRSTDCSSSHIETILTVKTATTYRPSFPWPGISGGIALRGQAVQTILNQ